MQYLNDIGNPSLSMSLYNDKIRTEESEWQLLRALKLLNQKSVLSTRIKNVDDNKKVLYLKAWIKETENSKDAINFLNRKLSSEEIYNLLLTSVMLNQYSIPIQKAYTLQCVETNNFNFADYSLKKLKDLLSEKEYLTFAKEVEEQKEKRLSEIEWK